MTRALAALALATAACGPGDLARRWTPEERQLIESLAIDGPMIPPPDPTNAYADDPRAAALGQALFVDTALSRDGSVSCATCHQPERHFTDGLRVAEGLFPGSRNTPTVVGAAFSPWQLWDGSKDSLWSQALGPFENPLEHGFSRVDVVRIVWTSYRSQYEGVFGPLPPMNLHHRFPPQARPDPTDPDGAANRGWQTMTEEDRAAIDAAFANTGKALAAFQRRLVPRPAPFDRYVRDLVAGRDRSDAMTEEAIEGLALFIGKAECISCHDGPRFTDDAFHNLGVPTNPDLFAPDRGRVEGALGVLDDPFNCWSPLSDAPENCAELRFLDPTFEDFDGAFKTPSLRDVARTAPYMHAGQFATLREVIDFYDELPGEPPVGHREFTLQPLELSEKEKDALEAFLHALSGQPQPARVVP